MDIIPRGYKEAPVSKHVYGRYRVPLIKSPSKQAFKQNIEKEMHAGKPQNQALAIAYSVKHKAKKMAEGGMVNEDLHPEHNNPDATCTEDVDSEHIDRMKQEHDQPMEAPAEPKRSISPMEEDMDRSDRAERIMRAVRMAMGGLVPEGYAMGGSVDKRHVKQPEEDRRLAMNDTYPQNPYEESDTQAQDEGFGDGGMDNEEMPEDQMEARRKTRVKRALLGNE